MSVQKQIKIQCEECDRTTQVIADTSDVIEINNVLFCPMCGFKHDAVLGDDVTEFEEAENIFQENEL